MSDFDKQRVDHFATTQWSLVVQAGDEDQDLSRAALQELSQKYWYPLYAYARRRTNAEDAEDLTQEFFAQLLEKDFLKTADEERGRFRAFLLTAFKRFMANQHDRAQTVKRGGRVHKLSLDFVSADSRYSIQPATEVTPDGLFDRQWALTLLENVISRLESHFAAKGPESVGRFKLLRPTIGGDPDVDYVTLAAELDLSPSAVRVQVHRLRAKYRETLRLEIASTVSDPAEIDDEILRLFELLG